MYRGHRFLNPSLVARPKNIMKLIETITQIIMAINAMMYRAPVVMLIASVPIEVALPRVNSVAMCAQLAPGCRGDAELADAVEQQSGLVRCRAGFGTHGGPLVVVRISILESTFQIGKYFLAGVSLDDRGWPPGAAPVHDRSMRAAVLHSPGVISADSVPDPVVVVADRCAGPGRPSCICGSDLWHYRGATQRRGRIGHEFIGVVEEVGSEVRTVRPGDVVIAPFVYSCGVCVNCRAGWPTSCLIGGDWGFPDRDGHLVDAGQGQFVRVPLADGTLVATGVTENDERTTRPAGTDRRVGTGHHAALSAGFRPRRHGGGRW